MTVKPLIFFENEIRDELSEKHSNQVLERLSEIGYKYWIVFDDAGYYLISSNNNSVIKDLNRYLLKTWVHDQKKRIHNYDILAFPECRNDLFEKVKNYYLS
jgi:hypothetical protein